MSTDYPFSTRIQVRWGDMDALGHVNNAVYFTYCETARMAWWEGLTSLGGLEVEAAPGQRVGPGLVSASLDFKRQVRAPAEVDVGLRVTRIGGKSFGCAYGLYLVGGDGGPVATGASVMVWMDYAAHGGRGQALPLPEPLRRALAAYA